VPGLNQPNGEGPSSSQVEKPPAVAMLPSCGAEDDSEDFDIFWNRYDQSRSARSPLWCIVVEGHDSNRGDHLGKGDLQFAEILSDQESLPQCS
jgi:hypothetical protein